MYMKVRDFLFDLGAYAAKMISTRDKVRYKKMDQL